MRPNSTVNQKRRPRRLDVVRVLAHQRGLAVGLEEVGEDRVGVQRDVAEDVVEDVRLGEVVHHLARTDQDGGGELAPGEAGEEGLLRQVAGDAVTGPAGELLEVAVDAVEMSAGRDDLAASDGDVLLEGGVEEQRDAVAGEVDGLQAADEGAGDLLLEDGPAAVVEVAPDLVVVLRTCGKPG